MNKKLLLLMSIFLLFIAGCTNVNADSEEENDDSDTVVSAETDDEEVNSDKIQSQTDQAAEIESLKEEYEFEIESLKEEYELKIDNYKQDVAQYKSFVEKTIDFLSEDELLQLAKSEWQYEIKINEETITSNEIVLDQSDFEIVFTERQSYPQILPNEIHMQGMISGEYVEHLTIEGAEPNDISRTDGTVVTAFIYEFEDLSANTSFQIVLSDELKERLELELESNTITIHIH